MLRKIPPSAHIFFGNAENCLVSNKQPQFLAFAESLRQRFSLKHVVLVRQVHGVKGLVISKECQLDNAVVFPGPEADFIVTNQDQLGIAVTTADCLPVIFYDPILQVIAVAHVGWRGSVNNIGAVVLETLINEFGVNTKDVLIALGPSAQPCCYEVKEDFLTRADVKKWILKYPGIIQYRDGLAYYDNTQLTMINLLKEGIIKSKIDRQYNACTICNRLYHSYRRSKPQGLYNNQLTMAWLFSAF